jgi:hypothetical protein
MAQRLKDTMGHLANKRTTKMNRMALLAPLAMLSLTPLAANALLITPSTAPCGVATCLLATGNQTGQAHIDIAIAGLLSGSTEIYKQNVGGSETGSVAGSYLTTFFNTPTDPAGATIEYVGGPVASATHLLVKDGNQEPAWYFFRLAWNGLETITLENFWPNNGAISHVTLYGGTPTTRVPEPGTMGLLGAGLLAFGFLRRRKAS